MKQTESPYSLRSVAPDPLFQIEPQPTQSEFEQLVEELAEYQIGHPILVQYPTDDNTRDRLQYIGYLFDDYDLTRMTQAKPGKKWTEVPFDRLSDNVCIIVFETGGIYVFKPQTDFNLRAIVDSAVQLDVDICSAMAFGIEWNPIIVRSDSASTVPELEKRIISPQNSKANGLKLLVDGSVAANEQEAAAYLKQALEKSREELIKRKAKMPDHETKNRQRNKIFDGLRRILGS